MPRKSSRGPRPFETVMDELAAEGDLWDLDKHLNGCVSGYQTDPSYGAAVYFALEALWGIARDVSARANSGNLDPEHVDAEWIIKPETSEKFEKSDVTIRRAWARFGRRERQRQSK
jgi:hypothetical protein